MITFIDSASNHQKIIAADELVPSRAKVLFYQGSLYRKELLLQELGINHNGNILSDTELVSAVIERYHVKALDFLEGAYVAIVSFQKKILAFRGVYDSPTLYWSNNNAEEIVFSSDLRALLKTQTIEATINYHAVRHFLAFSHNHASQLLYTGVKNLEPGHLLEVSSRGNIDDFHVSRLVKRLKSENRYKSWMEALNQSTRDCSDPQGATGLFLSGGIDSSALLLNATKDNINIAPITLSLPEYPNEDEWPFAKQLAHDLGIKIHNEVIDFACFDNILDCPSNPAYIGLNPYQNFLNQGYDAAHSLGLSRVWLGSGGDEIFPPKRHYFRDMYRDGYWWALVKSLLYGKKFPGAYKCLINDVLNRKPRPIRKTIELKNQSPQTVTLSQPTAIDIEFSGDYHVQNIFQSHYLNAQAIENTHLKSRSLERVNPFIHPAVCAYGLNQPAYRNYVDGLDKYSLRLEISKAHSSSLAYRERVGVLNDYYWDGWNKNKKTIESLLFESDVPWFEFLCEDHLRKLFKKDDIKDSMFLLNCVSVAHWYRGLQ